MGRKTRWIGCLIIALWTLSPVLSVLIASAISSGFDCRLDEGGVHPCVVFGTDIGESLNTMFVMGWFAFFTLPSGLIAAVLFLVIAFVANRVKRRLQG